MNITILGGTGWLGSEIAHEAKSRGHKVISVSRNPEDIKYTLTPDIPSYKANAASPDELLSAVPDDTDVLVNSLIPDPFTHSAFSDWCSNAIACCKQKQIPRLIAIGDACVFEVRQGLRLNQTAFLTPFYRDWFGEHVTTHEIYIAEKELNWVEISPAAKCLPDIQRKEYMVSVDSLCTLDPLVAALETPEPDKYPFADTSYISTQDFAYAVLDEIEQQIYCRKRICVA